MSDVDISKLKVAELREELKKHGLDTKGKKEQLVKRLENFLSGSGDASLGEGDPALSLEDDSVEASQDATEDAAAEPAPVAEEPAEQVESAEAEAEPAAESAEPAMETEETAEAAEPEQMEETEQAEGKESKPEEVKEEEAMSAEAESTDAASGEKRKRSRSPEKGKDQIGDSPSYKRDRRDDPPLMELQDWVDSEELTLDRYNCDLNIEIVNDGFTIKPNSFGGFGYMWGGLRANYGVATGKVAFQMKTIKNLRIQIGDESLGANHVSRVGWSIDCGNYQLGEYPMSWGYGGTAKFSTNSKFTDFGVKYYNGDVITCYLDFTGEENVVMSFAKNDMAMEKAVEIPKADLDGAALFPAFATKNQILEVNLGQMATPWYPLLGEEGEYSFIGKLPVEERVRALKPPPSREECEVLLLVGLPGAGKSYWALQRQKAEPGKRHYVLGTNNIIDKMKVEGLPRKANYAGRWDVLFDQANECLRKMLETAAKRLKNYILDQTNVYDTAQRRKMRPFAGFKRKAVVVLPTDKVFRERIEKRTKEEGKEVPETAVLEMKANFFMPVAPVEIALNPEANVIAIQEEAERVKKAEEERIAKEAERKAKEEERLAKEREREEKEAAERAAAAEKAKEEEEAAEKAKAEAAEKAKAEAAENGEEIKEEAEPAEDAEPKVEPTEGEEKAAADAAETEKPEEVKEEPEVKEEQMETSEEAPVADAIEAEEIKTEENGDETKPAATEESDATDIECKSKPAEDESKSAESEEKPAVDESKPAEDESKPAEGEEKPAEGEAKPVEEKPKEEEVVFDELWYTELSGDVARKLLAEYVKEGQLKFPPGSRRFRREDRRIGKDDRNRDYRRDGSDYRRDSQYASSNRGYQGGNRYGGYNQSRGYDNRNKNYQGSGGYGGGYPKGGPGGYRSGGYGKSYGYGQGGGWGGQQGGWGQGGSWGGQGWGGGSGGNWNQNYGNQGGWGGGGYNQGGYNQGGYSGGGGYGSGNWGGHSSGGSWNQNNYGGSGYGGGYKRY